MAREGQVIISLQKPISAVRNIELATLLLWHTKESKSAQVLKTVKLTMWNAIVVSGTLVPTLDK